MTGSGDIEISITHILFICLERHTTYYTKDRTVIKCSAKVEIEFSVKLHKCHPLELDLVENGSVFFDVIGLQLGLWTRRIQVERALDLSYYCSLDATTSDRTSQATLNSLSWT